MTEEVLTFLNAPRRVAEELAAKKRLRTEKLLGMIPGAIRYDVPRVQSSPSDRMSSLAAEVDELDREIENLRRVLRDRRQEVADTARALLPLNESRVIRLRYIDGLRWQDVARAIHRSVSTVHRLHRSACGVLDQEISKTIEW